MTARPSIVKYPTGLFDGARVKANKRYSVVNRRAPKNRSGTVTDPCHAPGYVRVKWDGCRHAVQVHKNLFDVIDGGGRS